MIGEHFNNGSKKVFLRSGNEVYDKDFIVVQMFEKTNASQWYLDKIVVGDGIAGHPTFTFPHFKWIQDQSSNTVENPLVIYSAATRLPQDDTLARKEARRRQTEQCKELYKWSFDFPENVKMRETTDSSKTLPGFILGSLQNFPSLHINFQLFVERKSASIKSQKAIIKKFYTWHAAGHGVIKEIDDYKKLANLLSDTETPERHWMSVWDSDGEFGRQILNGAHPSVVRRVRTIPDNFPVTDEMVVGLLGAGRPSLEDLARDGYIYMVDHGILEGVSTGWLPTKEGGRGRRLEVAPAMVMLYHDIEDNSLFPIAIQLGQTPG